MPTDLDEFATDPVEFDRVDDLAEHRYRLKQLVVVDAERIGSEYPKYGKFLDVTRLTDETEIWIETPRSLGRAIDDAGLGHGDVLDVSETHKDDDGSWVVLIDA